MRSRGRSRSFAISIRVVGRTNMKPITKWQANDGAILDTIEECLAWDDFDIYKFNNVKDALVFAKKVTNKITLRSDHFVYKIFRCGECLYIGRTNQLYSRLATHRRVILCGFNDAHIKLIKCPDKETSSCIERHYINQIKPQHNKYGC